VVLAELHVDAVRVAVLCSLLAVFAFLAFTALKREPGRARGVNHAEILVLVDNTPNPSNPRLLNPWGLSLYVATPSATLLFDTGPSPDALRRNAEALGVNLSRVDCVVLSHGHGDHTGGLEALSCGKVYGPPGTPASITVNDTMELTEGVYALRPLYGPPWETALLVNVEGYGGVLLVGCSHPGVVSLVREASRIARVRLVVGGLHMLGATREQCESVATELSRLGVERVCALHCSGEVMREVLSERGMLLDAHVGSRITVSPSGVRVEEIGSSAGSSAKN